MRLARLSLLFLLVSACAFAEDKPAAAAPPRPAPNLLIPDLPSANMYLSWDDFCRILDMLAAARIEEKPAPEPEPPVAWSLVAADYVAEANAASVKIQADIQLKVWKKGWMQAPVVGESVALESAEVDGKPFALLSKEGWLAVMLDTPGDHTVRLVFHVPAQQAEGVGSFAFKCARTPITRMKLHVDTRGVEFSANADTRFRNDSEGTSADLVFHGTEEINVSWRLPAEALPAAPPKEPPRITCLASTLATVTETHIACHTTLQYDILRGETAGFNLALPLGVNLLRVEGNGIGWNATEDGARQNVSVGVNHAITDHFTLTLDYEVPVAEGAAAVTVPRLDALEVARYSGFIALATRGNVEIDLGPESEGVQRIDTSDLPAGLEMQSPEPILHAFRHNEPEYLLALTYRKLAEVPVRIAGIETASVTSMLTDEGVLVTRAAYQVRNNLKKFLRVNLGPGAEVWGAQVAGMPVRPARDNAISGDPDLAVKPAAAEVVLIPLRKSSEAGGRLFDVEIVYARRLDSKKLWETPLEVVAPATDLLADRLQWDIYLPETRHIYHAAGDLKPVKARSIVASAAGRVLQPAGWERRPETIYRMREGIERYFIKDINNPAAVAAGTGTPRYDGAKNKEAAERLAPLAPIDTRVAGVLPIPVSFPLAGTRQAFERLLVPQDTPLKMTFHTANAKLVATVCKGLWLIPFLAGLLGGVALRRAMRGLRIGAVHLTVFVAMSAAVAVAALATGATGRMLALYVIAAAALPAARLAKPRLARLLRSPAPLNEPEER